MSLAEFRLNLEAIRRRGLETVTMAQLLEQEPPRGHPGYVALTFDDGLRDNYDKAFPLLCEFGMVATFFVVPGYDRVTRWVNPWTGQWSDQPCRLFTQPFASMNSAHRSELSRHGMEIGCHTYTHRKLTQVPEAELDREIISSKAFLEDELGRSVETFCYPNGRFNRSILVKVREAGYRGACSTLPGYYRPRGNRHLLNRFLVEEPGHFEAVLDGRAFAPVTLCKLLKHKLGM